MADRETRKASKEDKKPKRNKDDKDVRSKSDGKSKDDKKKDKAATDPGKKKEKSSKSADTSVKAVKESSRSSSSMDSKSDNGMAAKRSEPKSRQLPPAPKAKTEDYLGDIDLPSSEDEEEYETSARANDDEEREFKPQVLSTLLTAMHTCSAKLTCMSLDLNLQG